MTRFEWITATMAVVTALATSALAGFACTAFFASLRQLNLLREDSRRRTRPYVSIDLAPGLHGVGHWDLTIENVGQSMAREVQIDTGPLVARDAEDHISDRLATFLAHPMLLPPGARRRVRWRMEANDYHPVAGADSNVDVAVSYVSDDGAAYSDTFNIAIERYAAVAPAPTTGSKVSGGGRTKGEESLANIDRAIRSLNSHVGMLRH